MAEPQRCPVCDSRLGPHCSNKDCSWAKCNNCFYVGKPEENKWIPPLGTHRKDDDRR